MVVKWARSTPIPMFSIVSHAYETNYISSFFSQSTYLNPYSRSNYMPTTRKVGGIWFLRIGRLQFSFCLCRAKRPA